VSNKKESSPCRARNPFRGPRGDPERSRGVTSLPIRVTREQIRRRNKNTVYWRYNPKITRSKDPQDRFESRLPFPWNRTHEAEGRLKRHVRRIRRRARTNYPSLLQINSIKPGAESRRQLRGDRLSGARAIRGGIKMDLVRHTRAGRGGSSRWVPEASRSSYLNLRLQSPRGMVPRLRGSRSSSNARARSRACAHAEETEKATAGGTKRRIVYK